MKWDNSSEGLANQEKLKRMTLAGLREEDIAQAFAITHEYLKVLRTRLGLQRKAILPKKQAQVKSAQRWHGQTIDTATDGEDIGSRIKKLVTYGERKEPGFYNLSDEQLLAYRDNIELFAKECIIWQDKPLEFDDYQIAWMKDTSKFKIANKSRRIGLSFASAFHAFHKALFYPNSTELFVSIKEDRAKELMEYVYSFADSNPILFDGIFVERPQLNCLFTTGSRIISLSNSPAGVRGIPQIKDIDVHLDEFAHFGSPQDEKMYQSLIANVSLGGTLSVWSTPFGKRGRFYELWEQSNEQSTHFNGYKRFALPWYVCKRITQESIDEIKRATDDVTFRQEFLCEFVSTGTELFPHELVAGRVAEGVLEPEKLSESPYSIGIDFGLKTDSTAIIVVEHREDQTIIRHIREMKGRGIEFIKPVVSNLVEKYAPIAIRCDETGMGIPITRALQETLGSKVEGIAFTNQKKDALIMNLWSLFNDGKIQIPEHRGLKNQLVRLDRGETKGGLPTYSHVSGQHDDLVWALALACYNIKRHWNGQIIFGPNATPQKQFVEDFLKGLNNRAN